ncbi:hypothetical protein G8D19_06530 [Xanthomonas vesicatoria]|uniref:hypothetical protein n=1 Tax=Xanthomonas vesicatoria TaxID=56460 RepID=UPI00241240C7|nr:hypothetical protein [Xanthomonas vesicatoria]MDG4488767.1 hypothetical protein [Xanthomonas vesicatoria]
MRDKASGAFAIAGLLALAATAFLTILTKALPPALAMPEHGASRKLQTDDAPMQCNKAAQADHRFLQCLACLHRAPSASAKPRTHR